MQVEPASSVPNISAFAEVRALWSFAAVAAVIMAVSLVYWPTGMSMVRTWVRSETFAHGFLVVPATLWFVWKLRAKLASTPVAGRRAGLMLLVGTGFMWLLGDLAGALAPAQWAMVLMVPCAVIALFGWGWFRVLAFPLMFLLFAVPFGEVFVPTLIDWTADFTVLALQASGVPVFREGTYFVIPTGRWSVVQGCSGVRYLIASLMIGVLFAWTMYQSPVRRALFLTASVVVPLAANWFRAYLIVMLGHLSDNRIAAGVDHLIYGWLFFGLIVALLFLVGMRWRENRPVETLSTRSFRDSTANSPMLTESILPPASILIAAALVIGVWPFARDALLAAGDMRPVRPVPIEAQGGWSELSTAVVDWRPALEQPSSTQIQSFSRTGAVLTVFIGHYRNQRQGSELVNAMNRPVSEEDPRWIQVDRGEARTEIGGRAARVEKATLRDGVRRIRIWHWYGIDGEFVTSDLRAKLSLAIDRLLVRSDSSAWVAVYSESDGDADSDRILAEFMRDMGPAIRKALLASAAR